MNSKSSKMQNEEPSIELVRTLGWKEESPGVYVAGKECSGEVELSSLVTIDPATWDETLDEVEAEAAELSEQRSEELVEGDAIGELDELVVVAESDNAEAAELSDS